MQLYAFDRPLNDALVWAGIMLGVVAIVGTLIAIIWQDSQRTRDLRLTEKAVKSYGAIYEIEVALASAAERKPQYGGLSVVGIYLQRQSDETRRTVILLLVLECALLFANAFHIMEVPWVPLLIVLAFMVLVWTNDAIFRYRVGAGYFGTNRREALKLIRFIEQESENIDFTDGGTPKKIISDEDLAEVRHAVASGLGSPLPAN